MGLLSDLPIPSLESFKAASQLRPLRIWIEKLPADYPGLPDQQETAQDDEEAV